MARSRLLDGGKELMQIYPEVKYTNRRGETVYAPSDTPITIRVSATYDRPSDAELPGQVHVDLYKIFARQVPFGTWARIVFRGEEWDLAKPPTMTHGLSKTTKHVEFTIRSRNNITTVRH